MTMPPLPRHQFPIAERTNYLNHAAVAPLPRVAVDAARTADETWMLEGSAGWPAAEDRAEEVRAAAARLMGAGVDEVAFVKNTTEGLAFVAGGLEWEAGDRIVIPDLEYPSTLFPFLALERLGVEVVRIAPVGRAGELPLEQFEEAISAGPTKLVVLSWVQYSTGWRTDLAGLCEIAHRQGALVCADVIQGLGVVPCDLTTWGVDFATADGHKWMLGPQGVGVLYVARRHLDTLRVLEPGWNSVATRDDSDALELVWDPTARRYEGGTHNLTGIAAFGASLDLLATAGPQTVWSYVDQLCCDAADALVDVGAEVITTRHPDHRSALLTFAVSGVDGTDLKDHLATHGIVSKARAGGARISPHAWNTTADLDAVVAAVQNLP